MSEAVPAPSGPEQMRRAMADFVAAVHEAYLAQSRLLPPADQARLPLVRAGHLTVVAAGARNLHVVATEEPLPAPSGPEVAEEGRSAPLTWTLRFFDPVVLPALGVVDESAQPQPEEVRRLLGVRTCLYHLVVQPGSQLTRHHATHAGTALANAHAAQARDLEAIRAYAPGREALVDELAGAAVAGLPRAQALLAAAIAPADSALAEVARQEPPDPERIRRALLNALRAPGAVA